MKTPIAIFHRFFGAAKHLAKKLGMFCSEVYSKVKLRFLDESHAPSITEQLNAVYQSDPELSRIDPLMTRLQMQSLPEDDW
jgi:hypothetical protein